jgi:hypothetical protein
VGNRFWRSMVALAAVVGVLSLRPVLVAGQAPTVVAKRWNPPRTPDGQPDIQGFWNVTMVGGEGGAQYSLEGLTNERHSLITGQRRMSGRSVIVDPADGKIPYQPWAAKKAAEHFDNVDYPAKPEYIDGRTRCYLPGVPRQLWSATGGYQIVQTPGYVVMMIEFTHAYRIIPLEGRPHVGDNIKLWQGDSRGHWEGNTLVVDVTNLNDQTWFDIVGNFHSDAMRVVERFTVVDADTIHYEATIDDAKVYTRPWKIVFTAARNKQGGFELMEHACHEGERSTDRFLSYGSSSETTGQKTR